MLSRARDDFHRQSSLTDPSSISAALLVAHTQLDNLDAQVVHMRQVMQQDMLVHRGGMVEWSKDEEATRRHDERERKEKEERKRMMQQIRQHKRQQQQQTEGKSSASPSSPSVVEQAKEGSTG